MDINTYVQLVSLEAMGRVVNNTSSINKKNNNETKEFTKYLTQAIKKAVQNENNGQNELISPIDEINKNLDTQKVEKSEDINKNIASLHQNKTSSENLPPSKKYDHLISESAKKHEIEPALLKALIKIESNFNETARSRAGALGLTQIMPQTANYLGVDPLNPAESIEGGAKYLAQMLNRYKGNIEMALAAYNAGPGSVDRYGGIPPYRETHFFIDKVKQHLIAFKQDF